MHAQGLVAWVMLAACAPGYPDVPDDCRFGEIVSRVRVPPAERTDLVLVVDTHATTDEARNAIALRLAAVVRVLASGDADRDGHRELDPIHDLAITILTAEPGCGSPVPIRWRTTAGDPADPDALEAEVAAHVADLSACARSAPLEAAAVLFDTAPTVAREHAHLGLLVVTDEDEAGAAAHAVALSALQAIHGPPRAMGLGLVAGFGPIVDPLSPDDFDRARSQPGCERAPMSADNPVELLDAFAVLSEREHGVALWSLCDSSWISALGGIGSRKLSATVFCHCLPRPAETPDGSVVCAVTEQLGPSGYHDRCEYLLGRDPIAVGEVDGFERCPVLESDGLTPGWYGGPAPAGSTCGACRAGDLGVEWRWATPEPGSEVEIRCVSIGPSPGCDDLP